MPETNIFLQTRFMSPFLPRNSIICRWYIHYVPVADKSCFADHRNSNFNLVINGLCHFYILLAHSKVTWELTHNSIRTIRVKAIWFCLFFVTARNLFWKEEFLAAPGFFLKLCVCFILRFGCTDLSQIFTQGGEVEWLRHCWKWASSTTRFGRHLGKNPVFLKLWVA